MRLAIASFNMHLGVDGWSRPFDVVGACAALDAEVIALQEVFADAEGNSLAKLVADRLGYLTVEVDIARVRLQDPLSFDGKEPSSWGPGRSGGGSPRALLVERPPDRRPKRKPSHQPPGRKSRRGTLRIAVLSRLPVEQWEAIDLPNLARDPVRRKALVVELGSSMGPLQVVASHFSHLLHGSPRQFLALRRRLGTPKEPTVVLGDMNCWGPPLSVLLPGFHRAVRGPTWPAWQPHSQVDHILLSPGIAAHSGQVLGILGSDHRPIRAELSW